MTAAIPLKTLHDFPGGVHPEENKAQSTRTPIATPPLASEYILPLNQHSGAAAQPLVAVGDKVLKGQMLARASGFVSAPVHAPTSGTITAIEMHSVPHWSGLEEPCLILAADGNDRWCELSPVADYTTADQEELVQRIHDAGVVGLGGAGFPAAVKMASRKASKIHTLVVNGAECEPYITADDMLMRERAAQLISGIEILQHLLQPEQVMIGIEDNKQEALQILAEACADKPGIDVYSVPTKYPSGDAQRLIWLLTGKEVPNDARSVDIGILCYNVGTIVAIHDAIIEGKPLISRITTITGEAVSQPQNVEALIGTPAYHLLRFAGLNVDAFDTLIQGGPMMGHTLDTDAVPVTKLTNCLIAGTREEFPPAPPAQACIRCGLCAEACPISLLPQQLYWYAKSQNHDQLEHHNLFDCIECGACSYVCPSSIPLVQYYRAGKDEIRTQKLRSEKAERSRVRFEHRQERLATIEAEKEARRKANAEKARKLKEAKEAAAQSAATGTTEAAPAAVEDDPVKAALARAQARKAARTAGAEAAPAEKPAKPQLSPRQKELKIQLSMAKAQLKKSERALAQMEAGSDQHSTLQSTITQFQQQIAQLQQEYDSAAEAPAVQTKPASTEAVAAKPKKPVLSDAEKKFKIELAMKKAAVKKAERALASAEESNSDDVESLRADLEQKRQEITAFEQSQTQAQPKPEAAEPAPTEIAPAAEAAPKKPSKPVLSDAEKKFKIELAMKKAAVKKAERALTAAQDSGSPDLEALQTDLEQKRQDMATFEQTGG
ncbi:electron transport complex subunit RsxC [Parendozoicomonas haliclonae]|uniref:Ion-translocating oxidoreductase complex subunit C n=1 Tax=Parendozoicomonas haliclonae TaxID=1960125 RepID=A0A1X7AI95_9GAMM|nr:electron transport complex subunit RsxC [Parendozoicomonas haliclonae]SMA43236.1 Electron transport complex protein RnfC [Parendozoicomonas haliclonae]